MQEDSAAAMATTRPCVVIEHNDDVVNMIGAPQVFRTRWIGQAYEAIVVAIERCVAPTIAKSNSGCRQRRLRPRLAIGPVQHADRTPGSDWCRTIAFAFYRSAAAATDSARQTQWPDGQKRSVRRLRSSENLDVRALHRRPFSGSAIRLFKSTWRALVRYSSFGYVKVPHVGVTRSTAQLRAVTSRRLSAGLHCNADCYINQLAGPRWLLSARGSWVTLDKKVRGLLRSTAKQLQRSTCRQANSMHQRNDQLAFLVAGGRMLAPRRRMRVVAKSFHHPHDPLGLTIHE